MNPIKNVSINRGTNKDVIIFFVLEFILYISSNLAHPVTPTFFKQLELNDYMFGVAFATMAFATFLFSPFWGKVIRIISEKRVLAICAIGYSIGQYMFMTSSTELEIFIARMIGGLFSGGIFVGFLTYITYISSEQSKAKNIAILATIATLGGTVGYFLGGLIGNIDVRISFITQIIMLNIMGIFFGTILVKRKELEKIDRQNILKEINPFTAFFNIIPYLTSLLSLLFLISFLASFATTAFDQTFNYYLIDQLLFQPSYNGFIKAGVGLVSLFSTFICFKIIAKQKILSGLKVTFLCCSLSLAGVIGVDYLPIFLVIAFIYFACNAVYLPLVQNIASSFGDDRSSSIILAFYNATKSLGMIIGALVAGYIYDWNPKIPFIIACILFFICYISQRKYIKLSLNK
ncbi:MAG: hypothetical protein ATN31_04325 [Candidatus Epulonipiscioides saccharophilum]|nr:MAG: hypothetical protein ATN31_04325 [Epulopiscium sp. AS2M-Bin001]